MSVAGPFGPRCPSSRSIAPFPLPARRTERALFTHSALGQESCFRPRKVAGQRRQIDQPECLVQVLFREACPGRPPASDEESPLAKQAKGHLCPLAWLMHSRRTLAGRAAWRPQAPRIALVCDRCPANHDWADAGTWARRPLRSALRCRPRTPLPPDCVGPEESRRQSIFQ